MYSYGQRCDACVWPHGLSAAPLRCCSAWCSPVSLLLFAIGVSSDARSGCARLSTCVQRLPASGPARAACTAVQFARDKNSLLAVCKDTSNLQQRKTAGLCVRPTSGVP